MDAMCRMPTVVESPLERKVILLGSIVGGALQPGPSRGSSGYSGKGEPSQSGGRSVGRGAVECH